jgi:hypothetical protein
MITSVDERRHPTGDEALWGESFSIDFARPDGTGGFLRLGLYPNLRQAWWWTYLVTPDRLVAVRDQEVALPRSGLEVRAEGLWADLVCETPLEHWSVGLEAFGVALDDPADAFRGEWGERLPVGLDLSWEASGPPGPPGEAPGPPGDDGGGYVQPGRVDGEVLIGAERLAFDGWGWRSHRWGLCDWWSGSLGRHWGAFTGEDGTALSLAVGSGQGQAWWRRPPDGIPEPFAVEMMKSDLDIGDVSRGWRTRVGDGPVAGTVLGLAVVPIESPDGRTVHLARTLCRAEGVGFEGVGWFQ